MPTKNGNRVNDGNSMYPVLTCSFGMLGDIKRVLSDYREAKPLWHVCCFEGQRGCKIATEENSHVSSIRKIDLDNAAWLFITQVRG